MCGRYAIYGPLSRHREDEQPVFTFLDRSVPVTVPVVATGRVKPSQWPAMKVARTVYTGPYEGLPAAWGEFMDWIEANGHTPAPDLWECYVTGPQSSPDSATWRTELNQPLITQV